MPTAKYIQWVNFVPDTAFSYFLSLLLQAFPATLCQVNSRETNLWNTVSSEIQVSRSAFYHWEHGSRLVRHCTFFLCNCFPLHFFIDSLNHVQVRKLRLVKKIVCLYQGDKPSFDSNTRDQPSCICHTLLQNKRPNLSKPPWNWELIISTLPNLMQVKERGGNIYDWGKRFIIIVY